MNQEKMDKLEQIKEAIKEACLQAGRKPEDVTLLAVSKTKDWEEVRDLMLLGQRCFGENYVQEGLDKIEAIKKWAATQASPFQLDWHFIGNLQSNKSKFIPGNFRLFHALDSLSLAEKIASSATAKGLVQECLVEVNLDGEESKGGVSPDALPAFLESLNAHGSLTIRGLMCIPAPVPGRSSREPFSRLRKLQEEMDAKGIYKIPFTKLSMGMSGDFREAILEGSTIVRIGTALFGPREK